MIDSFITIVIAETQRQACYVYNMFSVGGMMVNNTWTSFPLAKPVSIKHIDTLIVSHLIFIACELLRSGSYIVKG